MNADYIKQPYATWGSTAAFDYSASFLGKHLEQVVPNHFKELLDETDLLDPFQLVF